MLLQVPQCASVKTPSYSFPEKFSSFSFASLLTKAEVIAALVKVRTECNKVRILADILMHAQLQRTLCLTGNVASQIPSYQVAISLQSSTQTSYAPLSIVKCQQ